MTSHCLAVAANNRRPIRPGMMNVHEGRRVQAKI
eukprot:SAG22_NODE_12512_length_440_cov_0.604106_2_plen_33_part_01